MQMQTLIIAAVEELQPTTTGVSGVGPGYHVFIRVVVAGENATRGFSWDRHVRNQRVLRSMQALHSC